ncbi:MAG TPA: GGDEF domain-containing protein [Vicinamibacterales bacterium]|nr:GGDEF domain-containing protein [Vicinamibacterales bacterium]
MLHKATIDSSRLQSRAFLAQVEEFRRRLDETEASAVVATFPDACDDYLTRARAYLLEREHEYAELIDVLRETVSRLAGESSDFHAELLASSDRMERLVEIDDLRELKTRIARESSRLKEATEEQKRNEEKTRSRLQRRIETLQVSLSEAREQAATDALTGIANRGRFDEMLGRWLELAGQSGEPFVLAIADIDHFKAVNDTHGHLVGDRVILCAAQWLQSSVRDTDFVARYGGEEFAVLFSRATAAEAEARLARVLQELAARPFTYDGAEGPQSVCFTLSAGVAESGAGDTLDTLVRRADEALYQAKKRGRNRVVVQSRGRLASLFR